MTAVMVISRLSVSNANGCSENRYSRELSFCQRRSLAPSQIGYAQPPSSQHVLLHKNQHTSDSATTVCVTIAARC